MTNNLGMVVRLSLLQFIQYYIWGSWFVTAGTYMLYTLDFSGREVGLLYGCTAIAATISPFLLGVLADRFFSVEKLLAILHFIGGLILFGISYVQDFIWFYPLMLLYMLCYMPTFSLSNSMCFHHVNDAKKDFPKVRVWGTVSWILAGLVVSFLNIEYEVLPFRIAAICSFIQAAYSLTLPSTPPQKQSGEGLIKSLFGPEVQSLLKEHSFKIIILSIMLICIPASYYYSFVNPFLNEVGVKHAAGKMALGQVTEILLMLVLPWIYLRFKLKSILFWGLFVWGARYGLFMLGIHLNQEIWFILALLLHGLAFTFAQLTAQIYLDTKVPSHLRSTAQGFYSLLTLGLGVFIGSWIAGETINLFTLPDDTHDWMMIWVLPCVLGILVSLGFLFSYEGKNKEYK